MSDAAAPAGYESFQVGRARVVARSAHALAVRQALADAGTLLAYAAGQPRARSLTGRGAAWASTLSDGAPVVVRHSRHGGLFAPMTGDLFLAPTRAPRELAASLRLASCEVPTPEIVAYAVYPALGPFARADVATRRLEGVDLDDAWRAASDEPQRLALMAAVVALLGRMWNAGAGHPDLNVKNVFITQRADAALAVLLDVDRVAFREPKSTRVHALNVSRLFRSAAKRGLEWQSYVASLARAPRPGAAP